MWISNEILNGFPTSVFLQAYELYRRDAQRERKDSQRESKGANG